jgi:YaaC-like Protein
VALEQAEQMFRAAATVGQATRPVLAYYGLNQAGRAVAAAAATIQMDGWRLSGHGIYAKNLESSLPDIAITCDRPGARGSFARLSEILDSPLWEGSIVFRIFWDSIPETRLRPLVNDQARRNPLYVDETSIYGDPHPLATVPVVYFPPWLINSDNGRVDLDQYLDAYPGARCYHSYVRTGQGPDFEPQFTQHVDGWGELQMNWQATEDETSCPVHRRLEFIKSITRPYCGNRYFFPVVGNSDSGIHPLMAWWAVLHSLSMLARYRPAEWSSHIDVDRSQYAVALEVLLSEALAVVPALIAETIEQVAVSSK